MGILSNVKDRAVEQMALMYLNKTLLLPYGQATSLRIDSTAKEIYVTLELKGEKVPLEVKVLDYEITKKGQGYIATIKKVRTSREWLTGLAESYLQNVPLKLPPKVGSLLAKTL